MRGTGTIVNVLAVLAGGSLGLCLKKGLKERYQEIVMQALGLCTIFIGISGALKEMFTIENGVISTSGTMLAIFSLVAGSLVGEWANLEHRMETFGEWLKEKCGGKDDNRFVEGFVAASLTICIGAMAIVGSLQDGMTGDASMLNAKAVLDGVILVVFASAYGKGALFSAIPVGILQGTITLFANALAPLLTDQIIGDLTLVGNMLIFCVGVNLISEKKFRVANMLPALIFVVVYDGIMSWL
ncbi:MAG: DUF554 domain-containing protein [Clostridiales bacterium]|nr:DUF554 domain-containing protein [Clostridiales bacterium]